LGVGLHKLLGLRVAPAPLRGLRHGPARVDGRRETGQRDERELS
jgi:hypothetical protein